MRTRSLSIPIALLLACLPATAEQRLSLHPDSSPKSRSDFIEAIDRYHETICTSVINFGEGMDRWLSNRFRDSTQPARTNRPPLVYDLERLAHAEGSQLILSPYFDLRDADGFSAGLRLRGKLELPRVSDRLDLVFDSDYNEGDLTPEIKEANRARIGNDERGAAGLRLRLSDDLKFRPSLELGLKFKPDPLPRIGLRLRLAHENGTFTTRFIQRFFWEGKNGWGERSSLDFEKSVRDEYLVRLNTSILWTETSEGVQAGETLQLYRFLSNRRAVGLKFGVYGPVEPSVHVETYSARVSWRQRMHHNWLFIKVEPGFDWPHDRDYKTTPVVQVVMDIIFGDWVD